MTHETSYSAQFKGETSKPAPADNKFLERRRIRTLYSEPYKEPPKVRNTAEGSQDHQCSWWDVSKAVRLGLNLPVLIPLAWHLHFGPAGAYRVPPRSWGLVEVDALWSQNFPVLSCKDVSRAQMKQFCFVISQVINLDGFLFSPLKLQAHHITLYPRNNLVRSRTRSAINSESSSGFDSQHCWLWLDGG